ncbi:MAG: hypothetical protein WBC44_08260 [Planctomycetaceae bacterium]
MPSTRPSDFDWETASSDERDLWLAQHVTGHAPPAPVTTCANAEFALLEHVRQRWNENRLLELAETLWDLYLQRREEIGETGSGLFDALHVLHHQPGDYAYAAYLVHSRLPGGNGDPVTAPHGPADVETVDAAAG